MFNDPNDGKVLGLVRVPLIGDDDRGRVIGWVDPPTFCESPTIAQYEAYKRDGVRPAWDPSRHKSAKNPTQCETAFHYDLLTLKGYREDPFSIGKNVLAGIVNAVVPGSDLGDAGSSGQILGQLIGTVGSIFVNPAKLVSNVAINLGGIGKALGSVLNSPITGSIVGSLLAPAQTTQYILPQSQLPATTPVNSGIKPTSLVYSDSNRTINTGPAPAISNVVLYSIFGVVLLVVGVIVWAVSRKGKKK